MLGILLALKASGHWELMSQRLALVPPAKQGGRVRSVLISCLAQAAKWNEALGVFQRMLGKTSQNGDLWRNMAIDPAKMVIEAAKLRDLTHQTWAHKKGNSPSKRGH